MPSKGHDDAVRRIAAKKGVRYNAGAGPDVIAPRAVVEVETPRSVAEGPKQLRGFRGPVYVAGTNQKAVNKAIEVTRGTTIGVMDKNGNVVRRSTRK